MDWQILTLLLSNGLGRTKLAIEAYEGSRADSEAAEYYEDYLRAIDKNMERRLIQHITAADEISFINGLEMETIPNCSNAIFRAGTIDLTLSGYYIVQSIQRKLFGIVPSGNVFNEAENSELVIAEDAETCKKLANRAVRMRPCDLGLIDGNITIQHVSHVGKIHLIGKWRLSRFEIMHAGFVIKIYYGDVELPPTGTADAL